MTRMRGRRFRAAWKGNTSCFTETVEYTKERLAKLELGLSEGLVSG